VTNAPNREWRGPRKRREEVTFVLIRGEGRIKKGKGEKKDKALQGYPDIAAFARAVSPPSNDSG
jgi:hypothetical protein